MSLKDERVLAFVAGKNSHGKRDATGAFLPEARRFVAGAWKHSVVVPIDNSLPFAKRRQQVEDYVADGGLFDSVAFFCHGWASGIQLGYNNRNVGDLASLIREVCGLPGDDEWLTVPLYCCSTGDDKRDSKWSAAGSGDNSFADRLRDALCDQGSIECRVMAHTSVAHTTKNPMVLFMDGMGAPDGGVGGFAPVAPGTRNWTAWKKSMRAKDSTLRYRMPYMDVSEIHEELTEARR